MVNMSIPILGTKLTQKKVLAGSRLYLYNNETYKKELEYTIDEEGNLIPKNRLSKTVLKDAQVECLDHVIFYTVLHIDLDILAIYEKKASKLGMVWFYSEGEDSIPVATISIQ